MFALLQAGRCSELLPYCQARTIHLNSSACNKLKHRSLLEHPCHLLAIRAYLACVSSCCPRHRQPVPFRSNQLASRSSPKLCHRQWCLLGSLGTLLLLSRSELSACLFFGCRFRRMNQYQFGRWQSSPLSSWQRSRLVSLGLHHASRAIV
jgi:hypothetical protein